MKLTQEQVLDWAYKVWGTDLGKPWSQTALLHITELATLAYEAGRKDENERLLFGDECCRVCEQRRIRNEATTKDEAN